MPIVRLSFLYFFSAILLLGVKVGQPLAAPIAMCAEQTIPLGKVIVGTMFASDCSSGLKLNIDDPTPGLTVCKNYSIGFSTFTPLIPAEFVVTKIVTSSNCSLQIKTDNALVIDTPADNKDICASYTSGGIGVVTPIPTGYVMKKKGQNINCAGAKSLVIIKPTTKVTACSYYVLDWVSYTVELPQNIVVSKFASDVINCDGISIDVGPPSNLQEICLSYPIAYAGTVYTTIPQNYVISSRKQTEACGNNGINTAVISSLLPIPTARFVAPATAIVNEEISIDGSTSTDPNNLTLIYSWRFGDGSTQVTTTPTVKHTYRTIGIYNITLTVNNGGADSLPATGVVVVKSAPTWLVPIIDLILN